MRLRLTIAAAGIALATALAVVIISTRTAERALAGVPTDTPTATPTRTPTATPTPIPFITTSTFTNTTASTANAMDVTWSPLSFPGNLTVTSNAPGCASPVVQPAVIIGTWFAPFGQSGYTYRTRVDWPTSCVDPADSVTVTYPFVSFFQAGIFWGGGSAVFFDSSIATLTPTSTSTPIATPTPIPTYVAYALDCDTATPGIQSNCVLAPGTISVIVDVIIQNYGSAFQLGALGLIVDNQDLTRLVATSPPCDVSGLNCNPDFDQVAAGGVGWACSPPPPAADWQLSTPGQQSYFGCFNGAADGGTIGAGNSMRVARITYDIPPGAPVGTAPLTLKEGSIYDDSFREMMSCNPVITIAGPCNGASITISDGPSLTPSVTPTFTHTAICTCPFPTLTPIPTEPPAAAVASENLNPTPAGRYFAIDCDLAMAGIQDDCTYSTSAGMIDVGVVLVNNGGPNVDGLATFNFNMRNPDTSRLNPPPIPDVFPFVNSNPDANDGALSPTIQCSPPPPDNDTGADGPGTSFSLISCFDGAGNGFPLPAGDSVLLARVHYNVPPNAQPGTVPLALDFVAAYDLSISEIGSCIPVITDAATCVNASITLVGPGPMVEKIPDGNENNADLSIPAANLWICEAGPCAGPGEGELRVIEHASNVHSDTDADGIADGSDPCVCTGLGADNTLGTADDTNPVAPPNTDLGLGAYEFSVEYDNFVIQSVNPCDIVFGTGSPPGAGANRGPVDELNSSAVNPDCFGDPGPAAPGSCAMSLILENIIHFGCASGGQNLGPNGDIDLASLLLIPHPDLTNDLFPGNNNGVLTVLKDNGCELVDTLGHPVSGSVNGGLTPYCRDLAITVRILEGDLDLDCDVDLTDAQAIASRYGAFFGGLLYSKWYDLEPEFHDLDIDIKDVQKIFGRQGSTCDTPIPAQPPLGPPTAFDD